MFIAKNLKRLRLAKELTQEDLAERLGVTAQAVSKWERDECYPDIALLPGLANCFGVTVDELLGMVELSSQERLSGVFSRMYELGHQGRYHEIIEALESALKVFPNNASLLASLGAVLALAGGPAARAVGLCEQALEECTSYKERGTVYATLCFLYQQTGAVEKAEQLARSLPHARESRELLLPHFLTPAKGDAYLRENLPGILTAICSLIDGHKKTGGEELRSILFGTYRKPVDPALAMEKITAFLNQTPERAG